MPISAPKIPEGLPELMRGLAKSVIKENPENLYVHAAEYFENLIRERDGELERGYQTFNAYQVYADYKEKGREKLGLAKVDGSSISDGDEGDESGSGGSGKQSRGRKRARRARKQSSREKDNPPTMVEVPPGGIEVDPQKLNSLSEESAPVPVIEQEVVKVHYNPPEASPPGRVVSAQSVEAEQAVSSVLDDEQMLDSDGTGGSKDTGDELVDHGDDVGTAPSTAEITEPCAAVEENAPMALQDMETCFMHANVDDLLEKHTADLTAVGDDAETAVGEAKILDTTEGEDIPEGPQSEPEPKDTQKENEPASGEVSRLEEKDDVKEADKDVENSLSNKSESEGPVAVDIRPPASPVKDAGDVSEQTDGSNPVEPEESVERPKSPDPGAKILGEYVEADETAEDVQERPQSAKEVVREDTAQSGETVSNDQGALGDAEDQPAEKSSQNEPRVGSPSADEEVSPAPGVTVDANEGETEDNTAAAAAAVEIGSEAQHTEAPVNVMSRMGLDDDETGGDDGDHKMEPQTNDNGDENPRDASAGNGPVSKVESADQQQNADERTNEEVNEDIVEVKTVQLTDAELTDVPIDNVQNREDEDQQPTSGDTKSADEDVASANDQRSEENSTDQQASVVNEDEEQSVRDEKEVTKEDTSSPEVSPSVLEPIEESVPAAASDALPLADDRQGNDIVSEAPLIEADDAGSGETKTTEDPASPGKSSEKEDTKEETDSPVIPPENATPQSPEKDITENEDGNDGDLEPAADEKDDQPAEPSVDSGEVVKDEPVPDSTAQKETDAPTDGNSSAELVDGSVDKGTEGEPSGDGAVADIVSGENTGEIIQPGTSENVSGAQGKVNDSEQSVSSGPDDVESGEKVEPEQTPKEGLTLQSVMMAELPLVLAGGTVEDGLSVIGDVENIDGKSIADNPEATDKENDAEGPTEGSGEGKPEENNEPPAAGAEPEQQADAAEGESSAPSAEPKGQDPSTEQPDDAATGSTDEAATLEGVVEEPCVKRDKREASMEEVIEEPCVRREVTPSKATRPDSRDDAGDKQVEELEEIKKVDLSQLSKDSAEALFYSLKKSELENQELEASEDAVAVPQGSNDDDDNDVVMAEEPPEPPVSDASAKRTFTDDFLDEGPITVDPSADSAPSDGVQQDPVQPATGRSSSEAAEQEDEFNPMVMASMRSKQLQEQLHSRDDAPAEQGVVRVEGEPTPARPLMRRCMTEMTGMQRYDGTVEDEPVDSRRYDPDYVEEEDQFDGYYIGHIKNKILASSVSVADSDYFDPAHCAEEPVDENNVRTALETIASTDTESTIASQATIQQAGKRSYLRKHSQNTSTNIPYASFGNAAIDQSLDDFIEREEQNKQDVAMAEAATKIQRSYRTHKKRLLRDYHSTMRTFTEDQSAESGEEGASNVIQIKLDQKRTAEGPPVAGDGGEESDSTMASVPPRGSGKRPMYSLNIDEYDTVARRMTLTRGVALQRNSTPEDDSGKSANVSTDRKPSLVTPESAPTSSGSAEGVPVAPCSSSEDKSDPPKVPEQVPTSSSGEPEGPKEDNSSSRSRPNRTAAGVDHGSLPKVATGRTNFASLDVQSLLLIARQRTMPVQIDSSVIRVLPKHMRKRISSAGMLNGAGKRK